jgi:hypothetical protein
MMLQNMLPPFHSKLAQAYLNNYVDTSTSSTTANPLPFWEYWHKSVSSEEKHIQECISYNACGTHCCKRVMQDEQRFYGYESLTHGSLLHAQIFNLIEPIILVS